MNVFLSYENRDRKFVEKRLSPQLNSIGVYPLIVDLQLVIGDAITSNKDSRLDQVLRNCEYVILILSKNYTESKWMQRELVGFLKLERLRGVDLLLPIIIDDCPIPFGLEDRMCADFRHSFRDGLEQLKRCLLRSRKAFVVMKFGDKALSAAYNLAVKPVFLDYGYLPVRMEDKKRGRKITDEILSEIRRSEIIYSDLTGGRPNCYYETGYAHALEKEIIFAIREGEEPGFDLQDFRRIIWRTPADLRKKLRETLDEISGESAEAPGRLRLASAATAPDHKPEERASAKRSSSRKKTSHAPAEQVSGAA